MKRGLFYPIRISFYSLKFENAVLFSPRNHSEIAADAHACKRNAWILIPSQSFFGVHIKLRWKMMKPNIKVDNSSQNGKLLLHFSRNLVAARRSTAPVRKFTKSPYTSLKRDYLSVFNKLFRVDDIRGLLCNLTLKRQSVSGRISKYRWNNKQK